MNKVLVKEDHNKETPSCVSDAKILHIVLKNSRGLCFGCNQSGYMLRNCPNRGNCFNCVQLGNFRNNCPNQQDRPRPSCGNCGNTDHFAISCPAPKTKCTVCENMGHRSQICRMRGTAPAVTTQSNQNKSVNVSNVLVTIQQGMETK